MNFNSDVSPIKHDEKSIFKVKALASGFQSQTLVYCVREI